MKKLSGNWKATDMKILAVVLIIIGAISRLLPHPGNFTPIAAIALFGAVYLPKKYALILPITAMFFSDLVIGFYGITMLYVYGSFLLTSLIGLWLKNHKNMGTILASSLVCSILFFLITNFGVWADPKTWYSPDLSGLMQSYITGLPFFKNTILGDLFYSGLFFGVYELMQIYSKPHLPAKIFKIIF